MMQNLTDKQQKKLDDMAGGTFLYRGRTVTVKGANVGPEQVRIINQGNTIMFPIEKLDEELDEFMPTDSLAKQNGQGAGMAVAVYQNNSQSMDEVEKVIMDSIKKIQDDPEYIPQAQEINDQVKTVINIQKQKIDMVREVRKFKKDLQ